MRRRIRIDFSYPKLLSCGFYNTLSGILIHDLTFKDIFSCGFSKKVTRGEN